MDHANTIEAHLPERYYLGELAPALRDEFEDHMADCHVCRQEVATVDLFAANAVAVAVFPTLNFTILPMISVQAKNKSRGLLIVNSAPFSVLTAAVYSFKETGAAPAYLLIVRRSVASARPAPDSVIQ